MCYLNFGTFCFLAIIHPTGPLTIPANTEQIIRCDIESGYVTRWRATFRKKRITGLRGRLAPGIFIMPINISSSILRVNTSDTDLLAVECIVVLDQDGMFFTRIPKIELFILGRL